MISLSSSWTDWGALCTSCAFALTAVILYQHWTVKKSSKESKKALRRTLTPIGKFALLSQTERNPSIISFFIALASKDEGMATEEFEQLWTEVLKRHERFRCHVSEADSRLFEEATNKSLHDYTIELPHPLDADEFKERVNLFLTAPLDVTDKPWQVCISSGPMGQSGAIINSKELIEQGYKVETVALFRVHHVLCDGVSISVVVKDICDERDKLNTMLLDAVEKYKAHVKKMGVLKRAAGLIMYYIFGSIIALSLQLWHMLTSRNPFEEIVDVKKSKCSGHRSTCWKYLAKVDDAKAVAKSIGHHTKLNDLFTALLSRALERQYEDLVSKSAQAHTTCPPKYISIVVPVHLTGSILPGQSIGNKVGAFVARVPFNPAKQLSSLSRLSKISKILSRAKRTPAPLISWFITALISKLGIVRVAQDSIVRANCHAVAVLSNVHGYPFEIHWRGMPVKNLCPFLPLPPKVPVGVLVTSYDGKIILSVESADERVVPDTEVFLDYMLEEYEAIKYEIAQKSLPSKEC